MMLEGETPTKRLKTCDASSDEIIHNGDSHAANAHTPSTSATESFITPISEECQHDSTVSGGQNGGGQKQRQTVQVAVKATAQTKPKQYPRKFASVFSSNQAIHQLTKRIVESYDQQEKETKSEFQNSNHSGAGADAKGSSHSGGTTPNQSQASLHDDDATKDDDECEITDSNVTNPFIHYPHLRHLCAVHPFQTNQNVNTNSNSENESFCENCYCKVCDIPAKQCNQWKRHCNACDMPKWEQEKIKAKSGADVICLDDSSGDDDMPQANHDSRRDDDDNDDDDDENYMRPREDDYNHHFDTSTSEMDKDMIGQKPRKDARIVEVLAHNLKQLSNLSIANSSSANRSTNTEKDGEQNREDPNSFAPMTADQVNKMEGDVPQLNLHNSFFVEGVRIGWPYPVIMPPQRQMAIHLTKAFKNKRHVVIESPTGTGKSAAILCSALAWQRYDSKTNEFGETTKIIYCSRTHSQVQQMVSSLRKTPYRPRMAILGSRDRLCIHKDLRPRNRVDGQGMNAKKNVNVNVGCQMRVGNTESFRKYELKKTYENKYDDDNPPVSHPGDTGDDQGNGGDIETEGDGADGSDAEGTSNNRLEGAGTKMCPHYRQLTSGLLAKKIHSSFVPDRQKVNCCSIGGEKTKLGTHDIEDLVDFGVQTNIKRGVALYRNPLNPSFGMKLAQAAGSKGSIIVSDIRPSSAAEKEATIQVGDTLVSVNNVDVSRGHDLGSVTRKIRDTKDPLVLDIYRGENNEMDTDEYSAESACPYYLSRILAKTADIVFCPYNYLLDPGIRSAMDISIENSILILDEAHNVEDVLRQEGSGKFGEIELLEMNVLLSQYAEKWKPMDQRLDFGRRQRDVSSHDNIPDQAHTILVFLHKIVDAVKESRDGFENDRGKNGVTAASNEYNKFKCPDDKEFEMTYFGPTGAGNGRNPVGCKGFFNKLQTSIEEMDTVRSAANSFHDYINSKRGGSSKAKKNSTLADRLYDLIMKLSSAFKLSEHYYISTAVAANGNLDFATGRGENSDNRFGRFKRKPKPVPQNPPRTVNVMNPRPRPCMHPSCNRGPRGIISHDTYCDGTTPRWQSHLIINLLTPGILMAPLLRDCRSVVLASGSLAPLGSLCSELHLLPPSLQSESKCIQVNCTQDESEKDDRDPLSQTSGRLQITPKPLEANHVVSLPKQLLAVSIGHFPDGTPLSVKMSNYSKPGFHDKLGQAIVSIIESIPRGGVLIFFPSFSFLRKCVSMWQNSNTWGRLIASKGEVVVEPSSSQAEFEEARDLFNGTIKGTGSCILLGVFRGKMSEGVSFNDDYARGVICVGVPFPSSYDRTISAKMSYNNEQRKFRNKGLLSGSEWYSQQAYRAIAQAIGRCIRHAADYGTIILLDSRHCDDGHSYNQTGTCRAHANLPKWMRHSVRTLRKDRRQIGRNDLLGGWGNLRNEMKVFFHGARDHSASVLEKQKRDFEQKQENSSRSASMSFDHRTRKWSSSQPISQSQSQSPEAV